MSNKLNIPHVCGIDALRYFVESGAYYNEKYVELLEQIAEQKKEFEVLEINYQDSDIVICINDIELKYSGKGRDGFHWFYHEFFRVGFKDSERNKNINDINVQVNAIGIYTLGLKSLIEYINKKLLDGFALQDAKKPITRAIKRIMLHSSPPTLNYFLKIIQEVKEDFALREQIECIVDNEKEDLSAYSDEGLVNYEESLSIAMRKEEHDSDDYNELAIIYQDVYDELVERGLIEPMPF